MNPGTETVSKLPFSSRNAHSLPELVNKHPWESATSPMQRTTATEASPHGTRPRRPVHTGLGPKQPPPQQCGHRPAPEAAWVPAATPGRPGIPVPPGSLRKLLLLSAHPPRNVNAANSLSVNSPARTCALREERGRCLLCQRGLRTS